MKTSRNFLIILLFAFLTNYQSQANSMPISPSIYDGALEKNNINVDTNCIEHYQNLLFSDDLIKDGKWKERWKDFWIGFGEGVKDGLGNVYYSGNDNPGFSSEDYKYFEKSAAQLRNKNNAFEIVYKIDQLIHDDSSVITNKQMLVALNGNEKLLSIMKKAMENSTFPKDTNVKPKQLSKNTKGSKNIKERKMNSDIFLDKDKSPKGFWRVLGYVVGYIVGKLLS